MKRSDYLTRQIADKRAKLMLIQSRGWQIFAREMVDTWEYNAFTTWKKTPSDDKVTLLELQMYGKIADEINEWADEEKVIRELRGQQEALSEIDDGKVLDDWIEEGQPLRKTDWLRRLKEMVHGK